MDLSLPLSLCLSFSRTKSGSTVLSSSSAHQHKLNLPCLEPAPRGEHLESVEWAWTSSQGLCNLFLLAPLTGSPRLPSSLKWVSHRHHPGWSWATLTKLGNCIENREVPCKEKVVKSLSLLSSTSCQRLGAGMGGAGDQSVQLVKEESAVGPDPLELAAQGGAVRWVLLVGNKMSLRREEAGCIKPRSLICFWDQTEQHCTRVWSWCQRLECWSESPWLRSWTGIRQVCIWTH